MTLSTSSYMTQDDKVKVASRQRPRAWWHPGTDTEICASTTKFSNN
ncbi:unnamed protein product [Strongylus vulgaris]|uniref:Uncharacterized protein n=1 Tax=Strongylus vulgaris TaxID=40348 RepID=A0A3P7IZK5_STRVU|nr:unnamed protein product [Strongylus vulgaris]